MSIVYRFHNVNGDAPTRCLGPYSNVDGSWSVDHIPETGHPSPYSDGWEKCNSTFLQEHGYSFDDCFCGFASLQDAYAWFSKDDMILMKRNGYTLHNFEVADQFLFKLGHQCVFVLKEATKLAA